MPSQPLSSMALLARGPLVRGRGVCADARRAQPSRSTGCSFAGSGLLQAASASPPRGAPPRGRGGSACRPRQAIAARVACAASADRSALPWLPRSSMEVVLVDFRAIATRLDRLPPASTHTAHSSSGSPGVSIPDATRAVAERSVTRCGRRTVSRRRPRAGATIAHASSLWFPERPVPAPRRRTTPNSGDVTRSVEGGRRPPPPDQKVREEVRPGACGNDILRPFDRLDDRDAIPLDERRESAHDLVQQRAALVGRDDPVSLATAAIELDVTMGVRRTQNARVLSHAIPRSSARAAARLRADSAGHPRSAREVVSAPAPAAARRNPNRPPPCRRPAPRQASPGEGRCATCSPTYPAPRRRSRRRRWEAQRGCVPVLRPRRRDSRSRSGRFGEPRCRPAEPRPDP